MTALSTADPIIRAAARTMVLDELDSLELFAHAEDGLGHLLAQQMMGVTGWTSRAAACLNLDHLLPPLVLCEERTEAELDLAASLAGEGSVDAAVLVSLEAWRWSHTDEELTAPVALAAHLLGRELLGLFVATATSREEFVAAARLQELTELAD